jgi:TolB-like protein
MTVDESLVRAALEKILASPTFATAGRHNRLLRYLVDRTLAGEGDQLKEYVLGVDVFDRADSFDPRIDSIVRVEVRRLRSRLEDYYREHGRTDPLTITIPRGSYVPVFESRTAGPTSVPILESSSSTPGPGRAYSPAVIIAAALSVVIVLFAVGVVVNNDRLPAQASSGVGVAVLPFEHYSSAEQDRLFVSRLTDALTAELARVGTLSVASRTSASRYANGAHPLVEIAKALNVDLVIEGSVDAAADPAHLILRLVDGKLDRKVWVGEYDVPRGDVAAHARKIAIDAAAAATTYVNR